MVYFLPNQLIVTQTDLKMLQIKIKKIKILHIALELKKDKKLRKAKTKYLIKFYLETYR